MTTTTTTVETPMYVGAPVLFTSQPKDFDGRLFGFAELQSVTISISRLESGADPVPVVVEAAMEWSETADAWEYVWATGAATAGNYRAMFEATDLSGQKWPDFIDKFKLTARRPMAPAGP